MDTHQWFHFNSQFSVIYFIMVFALWHIYVNAHMLLFIIAYNLSLN